MEAQRRTARAPAHNLFFALWPDADVRDAIDAAARKLKQDHAPRGRWIPRHRYHMTLHFLGRHDPANDDRVARAVAAGDRVEARAFGLVLDRAGSFANRSIPWWIGCGMVLPELRALWEALGTRLREEGIAPPGNTPLVAHVTVLRDAERTLMPRPIHPIDWPVREFALIDSQLGSDARYTVLRRWDLHD